MTEKANKALLPSGLEDLLPPLADIEESLTRRLLDCFASYGYQRVKPPVVEFEEGLLDGTGASVADQTFRLMDPVSQRMMGLRADITPQLARIADTRLKTAPRPLRLTYSGEVMRVRGTMLRPERQLRQMGAELIGAAHATMADAEVIVVAAEALRDIGIGGLSVDLNLPTLPPLICDALDVADTEREDLLAALARKDASTVAGIDGTAAAMLSILLTAVGPARAGLSILAGLDLPGPAAQLAGRLREVVDLVAARASGLAITIDPVESRGFEYHTGVGFTLFALGAHAELGRGGRYVTAGGEAATGVTLDLHMVRRNAPPPAPGKRIYVPFGDNEAAGRLRDGGWVTVNGLTPVDDAAAEAERLECGHVWSDDAPRMLGGDKNDSGRRK